MKNVINIEENELRLNSCMTEMAFGKTNYESIISQAGILAECDSYSKGKYHFSFSEWTFSEVKSFECEEMGKDDRYVFYCGKNPLSSQTQTLSDYFDKAGSKEASVKEKDLMFEAAFAVCSVLTQAAVEKHTIPVLGAGGILVDLAEDKTKILFLPQNLYNYSVAGLPEIESANLNGCWINSTLYDLPAICFNRSVLVYKMLTGRFPFSAGNQTERNADILDRKFLPLELSINGINQELAAQVNKGLKLNSNAVLIPGKKQKGKASEDLTPTAEFPLELLYNFKSENCTSTISDEEFLEKSAAYLKKQDSFVKTKRKIRRNTTTIVVSLIGVIVLAIIISNSRKSNLDNYTSTGLTSTQTIQAFLDGVNKKDTVLLDNLSKGKNIGRFVDSIGQLYVISKQRQVYYHDQGFAAMEAWLFYATDAQKETKTALYGITNVVIDGTPVELKVKMSKKKDKPSPITEEKGIKLTNGAVSVHSVDFYLLHTEGEDNRIYIEKIHDTYTLTFIKDRWIITDYTTEETPVRIDSQKFKNEYYEKVQANEYDVVKTVNEMRKTYNWLPTNGAMKIEYDVQMEKLKDPFGFNTKN